MQKSYMTRHQVAAFMEEKLKEPVNVSSAGGFMWEAWWHYIALV